MSQAPWTLFCPLKRVDTASLDADLPAEQSEIGTGFDIIRTGGVLRNPHRVEEGGPFREGVKPSRFL